MDHGVEKEILWRQSSHTEVSVLAHAEEYLVTNTILLQVRIIVVTIYLTVFIVITVGPPNETKG